MSVRLILVCDGAAYFDDGKPDYGTFRCTKSFPGASGSPFTTDDEPELLAAARKSGWRIGPTGDAMCGSCGTPDAKTLRFIEQIGAKLRSGS